MIQQLVSAIVLIQAAYAVLETTLIVNGTGASSKDHILETSLIVNGKGASIKHYPFMVSLRTASGQHDCGGSILNEYWILTAAHCVYYYTRPYVQSIQVGRSYVSRNVDDSVYFIEEVVIHPFFNMQDSFVNDIALLKLTEPLVFNENVQPVELPYQWYELDEENLNVTVIGWGRLRTNGSFPSRLQKVDYFAVPNEQCSRLHSQRVYSSQICAAIPGGGKGECNGDSGGPLLHDGVQVGIVSWSVKPCTIAPYPGVMTKVSHFIDFIDEYIE